MVIAHAVAREVPGALDLMQRPEAVIIESARAPEVTADKLEEAHRRAAQSES